MPTYIIGGKRVTTAVPLSDADIDEIAASISATPTAEAPQIPEPPKERPGFFGSFKEAMETLGLTDEAAVYAANPTAENRKKFLDAAKSKYESVGGFGKGENWEAFKELLGSSLGQMVAPISAATVGSLATPITGVVAGTSAIASQYGVQSLLRQAEEQERAIAEGRAPQELSLGKAAAATAGETALDVLQVKRFKALYEAFPFARNLVSGGKGATEAAEAIVDAAKEGTLKTTKQGIVSGAAKGVAFEVPQEMAQTALDRWQAGLSLTDAEAKEEFKQAAIGALVLGPLMGGATGYAQVRAAEREASDELGLDEVETPPTPPAGPAAPTPTPPMRPISGEQTEFPFPVPLGANQMALDLGIPTAAETAEPAPQMRAAENLIDAVDNRKQAPTTEQITSVAEGLGLRVTKDTSPDQLIDNIRAEVQKASRLRAAENFITAIDVRGEVPSAAQITSIAESIGLGIPKNATPEQVVNSIRTEIQRATTPRSAYQQELDLAQTQEALPLTMPPEVSGQADIFTVGEAVPPGGAMSDAEVIAALKRPKVLQAINDIEVPTKANISAATGLPDLEVQAQLNALKNEGIAKYSGTKTGWVITDPAKANAVLEAAKQLPREPVVEPTVEPATPEESGQYSFDLSGRPVPMAQLTPRDKLLRAFGIARVHTTSVLKDTTGLPEKEVRAQINSLKKEGVIEYDAKAKRWNLIGRATERVRAGEEAAPPSGGGGVQLPVPLAETGEPSAAGLGRERLGAPAGAAVQPAGRAETVQPALTERQQRVAFGKDIGAAQSYPGELSGRVNTRAQTAAEKGDFAGVVAALKNSKNKIVAEIAKRAEKLRTKITIDPEAGETATRRNRLLDEATIDSAKIQVSALDAMRSFAPEVSKLPDGAKLPSKVAYHSIAPELSDGRARSISLRNLDYLFSPLEELTDGKVPFNTKEDFQKALRHIESEVKSIGEDKLRLTSTASMRGTVIAGAYDAGTDTISVSDFYARDEHVLAHEIVHAQVVEAVANPTQAQKPVVQRLKGLFTHVKGVLEERKEDDYGITNEQEFLAEGLSNPEFQYKLSRIKYENTTAWDKFVQYIADLLGLKRDNAFTELLTVYSDLTNPELKKELVDKASPTASNKVKTTFALPKEAATPPAASATPPTPAQAAPFDEELRATQTPAEQRKTASDAVEAVGNIPNSLPPGTDALADGTRTALSMVARGTRQGAFSFLSLHHLQKMYRRFTSNLGVMFDIQNKEGAANRARNDVIDKNLKLMRKVMNRYSKDQQRRFFKIMHDTTVDDVEVLKNDRRGWKRDEGKPLLAEYDSIPPDVRAVYKKLREAYADYADDMLNALKKYMPDNEWQKIQKELLSKRIRVYLPLFRMGDYKITYTDKNGTYVSRSFNTEGEKSKAIRDLVASGIRRGSITEETKVDDILGAVPPTGFYAKVIGALREKGVDKAVITDVFNLYMDLLPTESVLQLRRKREGTAGYEQDPLTAYANIASRYARRISNIEFQPQLNEAHENFIADMKQGQYWLQYKDKDGRTIRFGYDTSDLRRQAAQTALREGAARNSFETYELSPNESADLQKIVAKQLDFYRNPKMNNIANQAGYFSYLMFLGGNISSAVIDVTHSPMVVYGILGGKHGFGRAASAMAKSNKYFFSPNSRPADMQRVFQRAENDGIIGEKRLADLAEFKKLGTDATGIKARADGMVNYVFANSDKYQRETTFFSAYELAKETLAKTKKLEGAELENAAYEDAKQVMYDSYGSAFPKAGPSISGNQLARLALTFKQYAINRMWLITTSLRDAGKGETKEVRDIARMQVLGYFGMAYLFSGVQGMPFVGAAEALADLLNGIFGDDDEMYVAKNKVREAVGALNFKGLLNAIFKVDIASRSGWDNMIWRDDPKRIDDVGVTTYALEQLFGPGYSYAIGAGRAIDTMKEGHLMRGLEQLAPRFVGNAMKAFRYGTEGATAKDGTPLVKDINGYNQFMQVLGFAPAEVAAQYEKSSALIEAKQDKTERASAIRRRIVMSIMNQDEPGRIEAMKEREKFNQQNPAFAISTASVMQSLTRLRKKINESVAGVQLTPKVAEQIMRETGYATLEEDAEEEEE